MKPSNLAIVITALAFSSITLLNAKPLRVDLNTDWKLRQKRLNNWYQATVPGTVQSDLMDNGIIDDPYFRLNERAIQWVDKEDWIYQKEFDVDASTMAQNHIEMVFEGLDTYADVILNGDTLLVADNMFRRWRLDVKPSLRQSGNVLQVVFNSPVKVDMPKWEALPFQYYGDNDQSANGGLLNRQISVFARKAGYHYGWDWGPRIVTMGIWRPAYIEAWSEQRISDVWYRIRKADTKSATVEVQLTIQSDQVGMAAVKVKADEGQFVDKAVNLVKGTNVVTETFNIDNPRLWWSNGLGEPYLYNFTATVESGQAEDSRTTAVGVRTIELVREKDAQGTPFYFVLNGHPVFMKGANYIPCDIFLPHVTDEIYERTVADAASANMNMLRVWGGGTYEDDRFYDLCDRYGILIWQDFMFGCSVYPYQGDYKRSVELEAEDNIIRLRNHPCIAIWCGGNECTDAWWGWGWSDRYTLKGHPEYDKIIQDQMTDQYFYSLPAVVKKFAPDTPYTPGSPFVSETGERATQQDHDQHLWTVWHGKVPISEYDKVKGRFFSEYGFQSFPEWNTIQKYAPYEQDHAISSDVMMWHQRGGSHANGLIDTYLKNEYWEPRDFRDFLYLNQVLQGKAIKTAIESHRRQMPYCMGTLYWQHNDCWPVASWSSRDWFGNWKAQHYLARNAFRPILVSPIINGEKIDFYVVSDLMDKCSGGMTIKVLRLTGGVVKAVVRNVDVQPESSSVVYSEKLSTLLCGVPAEDVVINVSLKVGNDIYENNYFPVAHPNNVNYPRATITKVVGEHDGAVVVTLRSDMFAGGVCLSVDGTDCKYEDNYFDLLPGEVRKVRIYSPLTIQQIEKGLNVKSLVDTRQ